MVIMKNVEMPERWAECNFCINRRTNDYGSFGECLLRKYKVVNCLACKKDDDCPLIETNKPIKEPYRKITTNVKSLELT